MPPAGVERAGQRRTLEDVFLALVGHDDHHDADQDVDHDAARGRENR